MTQILFFNQNEKNLKTMQTKILLISLAVCSTLLTGCGGGGGSSSDNNYVNESKDSLANGTRYYSMNYLLTDNNDRFDARYLEVQNKQFKDLSSNTALGAYLLTEKKLYTPRDLTQNTANLTDLTHWTLNLIGDVKSDWVLQRVNLSGKNMFDTVLPGYRQVGFDTERAYVNARIFLASHGKETFPSGSSCYRIVSQKDHVPSVRFNTTDESIINQSFADFDAENIGYTEYLNDIQTIFTYRYTNGIWQNIPWTTVYDVDLGVTAKDGTAVEFQNKRYKADYRVNSIKTTEQEAKKLTALLEKTTGKAEKREIQLRLAQIQSGCYIYNATAANALTSLQFVKW